MGRGLVPVTALVNELFAIPDFELVKFSPDILRVLTDMVIEESPQILRPFQALVHVLNEVAKPKFDQHRKALDDSVRANCKGMKLAPTLATCLEATLLEAATGKQGSEGELLSVCNAMDVLMKVMTANLLEPHPSGSQQTSSKAAMATMESLLTNTLSLFPKILSRYSGKVAQQVFACLLCIRSAICQTNGAESSIRGILPLLELASDSFGNKTALQLDEARLRVARDLFQATDTNVGHETRRRVVEVLIEVTSRCLKSFSVSDDVFVDDYQKDSVLSVLNGSIQDLCGVLTTIEVIRQLLAPCLRSLALVDAAVKTDHEKRRTLSLCLLSISKNGVDLSSSSVQDCVVDLFETDRQMGNQLMYDCLAASQSLFNVFPPRFCQLFMGFGRTAQSLAEFACRASCRQASFSKVDDSLCTAALSASLKLLSNNLLCVELFSEQQKEVIAAVQGDRRPNLCRAIMALWKVTRQNGISLTSSNRPNSMQDVTKLFLSPNRTVQAMSASIITDLLSRPECSPPSGQRLRNLLEAFDATIGDNSTDDRSATTILADVLKLGGALEVHNDSPLRHLASFLNLRLELRRTSNNPSQRGSVEHQLVLRSTAAFWESTGSPLGDKYTRELCSLLLDQGYATEAAIVLQRFAAGLSWEDTSIRKEDLLREALDTFERAGQLHRAVVIAKELSDHYESRLFDFTQLSQIHERLAEYYSKLRPETQRLGLSFFSVSFRGDGWADSFRAKTFVFRARDWESPADFGERLVLLFPGSQLLRLKKASLGSGKYLDIVTVQTEQLRFVVRDRVADVNESGQDVGAEYLESLCGNDREESNELPWPRRAYLASNDLRWFSLSRPFRKPFLQGTTEREEDILNLWTEKTLLVTKEELPGTLPFSEVVRTHSRVFNPIETAILAVQSRNKELEQLLGTFAGAAVGSSGCAGSSTSVLLQVPSDVVEKGSRRGSFSFRSPSSVATRRLSVASSSAASASPSTLQVDPSVDLLTSCLHSTIDSPVNGGTALYAKFLEPDVVARYPDQVGNVERLQKVMKRQVEVVRKCLDVHDKLVSSAMRPMHENFESGGYQKTIEWY